MTKPMTSGRYNYSIISLIYLLTYMNTFIHPLHAIVIQLTMDQMTFIIPFAIVLYPMLFADILRNEYHRYTT